MSDEQPRSKLDGVTPIVPLELAQKLRPLAGFRNVLVHGYLIVDLHRVHAVLNKHLDDIRELARHVDAYVAASARP